MIALETARNSVDDRHPAVEQAQFPDEADMLRPGAARVEVFQLSRTVDHPRQAAGKHVQ
jgi:hypothetical protein